MKPRSLALWIPCLLGALAINLLIFMPRASDLKPAPQPVEQQPDFWLASPKQGDWMIRGPGAPTSAEQLDARLRPDDEAATAPADWNWSGTYASGGLSWHESPRLRLGTESYSCVAEAGISSTGSLLEYGSFAVEGDVLRLHPRAKGAESCLAQMYIRVQAGEATCLVEPEVVPAFFYPATRPDSPFRGTLDSVLVRDEARIDLLRVNEVPQAYRDERERRAHLRLVEILPPGADGKRIARFEPLSDAPLERFDRVWWDGEVCTFVRASVREIEPKSVIALLDLPQDFNLDRIAIGSTFSRLPRLE